MREDRYDFYDHNYGGRQPDGQDPDGGYAKAAKRAARLTVFGWTAGPGLSILAGLCGAVLDAAGAPAGPVLGILLAVRGLAGPLALGANIWSLAEIRRIPKEARSGYTRACRLLNIAYIAMLAIGILAAVVLLAVLAAAVGSLFR